MGRELPGETQVSGVANSPLGHGPYGVEGRKEESYTEQGPHLNPPPGEERPSVLGSAVTQASRALEGPSSTPAPHPPHTYSHTYTPLLYSWSPTSPTSW